MSRAHGKIFVKFSEEIAAKQARYSMSGRTYDGRTVVGSFYPEHLFDKNELYQTFQKLIEERDSLIKQLVGRL